MIITAVQANHFASLSKGTKEVYRTIKQLSQRGEFKARISDIRNDIDIEVLRNDGYEIELLKDDFYKTFYIKW
jgi:hypothetical protein